MGDVAHGPLVFQDNQTEIRPDSRFIFWFQNIGVATKDACGSKLL